MDRDLRKEIEEADFALKTARAELAAARTLAAQLPAERAKKTAELQAQLLTNLAALEALRAKGDALEAERRLLQRHIDEGRSAVARQRTHSEPTLEELSTSLEDVVRPQGWRKGQPWYSRLLWWLFDAKEWK